MKKKYVLLDLFFTFFKIGLFTLGGGYVMVPLIEREMVNKKKWIAEEDIVDIIAITQSIPGALATNMAALVGYRIAKIKGAIVSVLGVISPSFIIIVLIAIFFTQFKDLEVVQDGFLGIRSVVAGLIGAVSIRIWKKAAIDIYTSLIVVATVFLLILTDTEPAFIIIGGLLFGLITYYFFPKLKRKVLEREVKKDVAN
jgi:chromate transporter